MWHFRSVLLLVLCTCDNLLKVANSWGVGSLGSPPERSCPAGEKCPAGESEGEGFRGAPSRPEPETRQKGWEWPVSFEWLFRISLKLITDAAHSSLHYCGTLCASIGLAAKWSYWLATAVVAIFILQLLVWTFKCWCPRTDTYKHFGGTCEAMASGMKWPTCMGSEFSARNG